MGSVLGCSLGGGFPLSGGGLPPFFLALRGSALAPGSFPVYGLGAGSGAALCWRTAGVGEGSGAAVSNGE